MAQQTGFMTANDWVYFFIEAGISTDLAKTHATKFADEKLTIEILQMMDRSMLKEPGVILMGETLCIFKQAKESHHPGNPHSGTGSQAPQPQDSTWERGRFMEHLTEHIQARHWMGWD